MTGSTLGSRLRAAIKRKKTTAAQVARDAATTDASISNWLNDKVLIEHVKAAQLFRVADAAGIDARELLLNDGGRVAESSPAYESHPVSGESLKLAIQLVTDVLAECDSELPPQRQAEAIALAYDLIEEGLPRAKVLRFVLSAVA